MMLVFDIFSLSAQLKSWTRKSFGRLCLVNVIKGALDKFNIITPTFSTKKKKKKKNVFLPLEMLAWEMTAC